MNSINNNSNPGQQLSTRIQRFGKLIKNIASENSINCIVPLETKGALLVDVACSDTPLPKETQIIYPRAIRYFSKDDISESKILLVDDVFFTGRHLKEVYEKFILYGAKEENIYCIAFLDFSSGQRDIDYVGFLHDMISRNIIDGFTLTRKETLRYLQKEMLEKTMPSVYDHLTIEAEDICSDKYNELLTKLSNLNRLLNYGQRGAYQAGSILLDDIFDGDWDVPPKARLWWNKDTKKLRITPVGFYSCNNNNQLKLYHEDIHNKIVNSVKTTDVSYIEEAEYEAKILEGRILQLKYLKKLLHNMGINYTIENNHLDRYYPNINITDYLIKLLDDFEENDLYERDIYYEDQGYYEAVNDVLNLIREKWDSQETIFPKDRSSKGYSATELFNMLPKYNEIEIHSALDYCFDYHYIAVFRRKDENGYSRCYRTTEVFDDIRTEEVYAVAVIYSLRTPASEFVLNKIFAILRNCSPQVTFDSNICITKHLFGDIVRIKRSEFDYCLWKHIDSKYWQTAKTKEGTLFRKIKDQDVVDRVKQLMDDSRLAGFRDTLTAVTFLVENSGIDGALLLDILTPGYGGVDYITHNLLTMLSYGSKKLNTPTEKTVSRQMVKSCFEGAESKLKKLLALYGNDDNVLIRLERQCTRLNMTYLLQAQAERIVSKAIHNKTNLIYLALDEMNKSIYNAIKASNDNNYDELACALQTIGVVIKNKDVGLKMHITRAADYINNTLYAIGIYLNNWEYYKKFTIAATDSMNVILGYDLTSERRKKLTSAEELTRFDEKMHKFIANWIIAFNGKLSPSDINSGDLRFGFFKSTKNALSAACWIIHHLEQLKHTKGFPVGPESLGIVVTKGDISINALGDVSGEFLDMSGHFMKGKIKNLELIDFSTGKVGRGQTGYFESQVWLLEHDSFEINKTRLPIKAKTVTSVHNGIQIQLTPVDTDGFVKRMKTPWIN